MSSDVSAQSLNGLHRPGYLVKGMAGLGSERNFRESTFHHRCGFVPRRVVESTGARVVNAVFGIPGALTSPIWLKADRVRGSRSSQTTKGHRWLEPPTSILGPSLVKKSPVDAWLPSPMGTTGL